MDRDGYDAHFHFVEFDGPEAARVALERVAGYYIHSGVFATRTRRNSETELAYWSPLYRCRVEVLRQPPADLTSSSSDLPRAKRAKTAAASEPEANELMTRWSARQEELRGYGDTRIPACLLCSRRFESADQLSRHEKSSDMHRENMHQPDLVDAARSLLLLIQSQASMPVAAQHARAATSITRQAHACVSSPSVVDRQETAQGPSRGSSLLAKMGWTHGQGLGATGTGASEPVVAVTRPRNAGLGHERASDR